MDCIYTWPLETGSDQRSCITPLSRDPVQLRVEGLLALFPGIYIFIRKPPCSIKRCMLRLGCFTHQTIPFRRGSLLSFHSHSKGDISIPSYHHGEGAFCKFLWSHLEKEIPCQLSRWSFTGLFSRKSFPIFGFSITGRYLKHIQGISLRPTLVPYCQFQVSLSW